MNEIAYNYDDFYVVLEETSPEGMKIEMIDEKNTSSLNYLKFRACLQSFGERNRNRRLWQSKHIKQSLFGADTSKELIKKGFPGENGHPIPPTGQVTMERIVTIDPNNICHKMSNFKFEKGDSLLYADIETLDDINGPGAKFAKNIMQGLIPSFSCRAVVPQRKNADGTTDVTGPGRLVTYDRVILPSHKEAYMDESFPVKKIATKVSFESAMESAGIYLMDKSIKVNHILDGMTPIMESACADKNGCLSINTEDFGRVIIPTENHLRQEIAEYMKRF